MTDKSQDNLRHEVIHIIGELVLDEMEWQAEDLKQKGALPVQIFEAVRDDLAKEIKITNPEEQKMCRWARSGCLYAKVWE
jgi:hypothetical protein